jgi:putative nucleotidyltransferase with HDIG domain
MEKNRVLVVDDEMVMCTLLSDMLKDKGYHVDYVQNATEGLKAMSKASFDVVIVDIKMPGMNGIEFLREVKLKEDPEASVIIITGYGSLESAQHALRLGAYDYITKPFDTDKIYFTIRRAVASRKLSKTNKELVHQLQEERNKLEQRVRERVKEAEFVYRVAREISSSLDFDTILRNIVDSLTERLELERCALLLLDSSTGELFIKYARGLNKEAIEKTKIKNGEKISGWVMEQDELIHSEDVNRDSRFARRKQERYYTRSLISIPLIVKNECIGIININNKKSGQKFTDTDLRLFREIGAEISIGIENAKLYKEMRKEYWRTIKALTVAIDAKDHYTKAHSEHVTNYAVEIARELGLTLLEIETIREASELHDLGKIGIHDYILTKTGKLTPQEWEQIKMHALKGAEIIEPLGFKKEVAVLIKQHHERYDGKGYPSGYRTDEIELGARIMAAADAYDAMITERPYRKAYSKKQAIEELKRNSGTQFDPRVVKAFLKALEKTKEL